MKLKSFGTKGSYFAILFVAFLAILLVLPAGALATGIENNAVEENAAFTETLSRITETFTFSGNIPVSPNVVTSSAKSLIAKRPLKVNLQDTTNSKAVKMRVINSSGTALTGWISVAKGTTATLYTPTVAMSVRVQLQSSQSYVMKAVGFWTY